MLSSYHQVHEYPWVWLRDNCQCHECYEPISHCRIINLTEWELNVRPASVENLEDKIVITWEDGHVSPFDKSWLASRSFKTSTREGYRWVREPETMMRMMIVRNRSAGVTQTLWGSELMEAGRTPTADYTSIMEDDRALLSWLEDLDRFGFVFVKNVPVKEGPVPALQVEIDKD